MKDILSKLANLEATAPKKTSKKMLKEDSETPSTNVSNKTSTLRDVFETMASGQKPIPVVGKEGSTQQTGAGFLNVTDPALQGLGKALGDLAAQKKIQMVVPTQPGQQPGQQPTGQTGQPNQAGATGQPMAGQQQMKEKDEGKPGKNFAKIAKSAGERYGSKEAGERVAGAVRAKLAKQGKLEEEQLDELSPETMKSYKDKAFADRKANISKTLDKTNPQDERDAAMHRQGKRAKGMFNADKKLGTFKDPNWGKGDDNAWIKRDAQLGVTEGAKVDRMVKHIAKSERGLGKSKGEAEDIAWATANKRGMLDNKNKKVKEGIEYPSHWDKLGFDVRSTILWPERIFESTESGTEFESWLNSYRAKVNKPNKYGNCILAMIVFTGDSIAIHKGNAMYIGQNNSDYKLAIDSGEHLYSKRNQIVFDSPTSFNHFLTMLKLRFGEYEIKVTDDVVTETKMSIMKKKVKEADIPSSAGVDTRGAGLGAGRSQTTLEVTDHSSEASRYDRLSKEAHNQVTSANTPEYYSKMADKHRKLVKTADLNNKVKESNKPDFLDLDKDGNKKESIKQASADKKKQKVKESMNHRISAARLEGKSHGLKGHTHCGKNFEDLEERKAYCDGYKDGLDECYGQGVYESGTALTPGADMEEGNAFSAALARTPRGDKFSVGGKAFTDRSTYDAPVREADFAFESLDKKLSALLNEGDDLSEGLSVSISKGQQNAPDSVTITAQDHEAEELLQFVKTTGLGLFGAEEAPVSSPMSVQPVDGDTHEVGASGAEISVVDGSDDMLSIMQKLGGISGDEAEDDNDYADEESEEEYEVDAMTNDAAEDSEEYDDDSCEDCGMKMDESHDCGSKDTEEEDSDENESSDDEEEEEVTESFFDILNKFNKLTESKEEDDEDDTASSDDEEDEEEDVTEGLNEWANEAGKKGTDASFEQDIDFMTKVIAGGLNKPKSTGQTTIPVIASQSDRNGETPSDWAALAGIKKS